MAKLKVSVDVPIAPDLAWARASDLPELDKWLTLHEGWRGTVPDDLTPGTRLVGVATVKGFRNRVTWIVETAEPPRRLVLTGAGIGGTKFGIRLDVAPAGSGSKVTANFELGGAPLFGPIGSVVAKALRGDIERSLDRFVELYG
ncbi:Toxin Rv0910/MT0934 [Nocardia otitidiscaviarum]|uniref:SRPBCC family protein n=1 Tax=Nocardia otitidiscaviarum TaxID=1823 RepID=A0A378YC39_9NOCA|nr:SRPBCC family protein [Nocardia otitidiscaviarum]MBF6183558.1 SRPBCC family protein [Nocardia otitidiscaviarum]MBF6241618.1 SRPBCC family protein [Nocardia otitidiscaviarum]MCP9622373.1 SRPBCC family protein [Nocardia otitidiscaviarum]QDP82903.1 SRPBCC family protein [Nocardia otitidiscaviarum]SUA73939.1 Toxin Rv0910/MT0934 [Nocardia otitidiscaviarum]